MPRPKNSGKSVQTVPTQYDAADGVEEIAKELIPQEHTHLINADIRYLFVNKEVKRKGKFVAATMEKANPKMSALSGGADFIMCVSYPTWQKLTYEQKLAVVDHELCHALVDDDETTGKTKKTIIPHDIEEFLPVIRRHKLYSTDLIALHDVVQNVNPDEADPIDLGDEDETDLFD